MLQEIKIKRDGLLGYVRLRVASIKLYFLYALPIAYRVIAYSLYHGDCGKIRLLIMLKNKISPGKLLGFGINGDCDRHSNWK